MKKYAQFRAAIIAAWAIATMARQQWWDRKAPELLKFVVRNMFRKSDYLVLFDASEAEKMVGRDGVCCVALIDIFLVSWLMPLLRLGQLMFWGVIALIAKINAEHQPRFRMA